MPFEIRWNTKIMALGTTDMPDKLSPEKHVVVVWNAANLTEGEKHHAEVLCDFADRGGRVVVLATPSWDWRELCDVKVIHDPRFSRVFYYPDLKTSLLGGLSRATAAPLRRGWLD
jgi:hypothetical protein